jgi:hypothetical protein
MRNSEIFGCCTPPPILYGHVLFIIKYNKWLTSSPPSVKERTI